MLNYAVILFPCSEIALLLFRRSREDSSTQQDRGSLRILWLTIGASVGLAIFLQWYPSAVFPWPVSISTAIALCLLVGGMVIRWLAILTLGRMFTVDVAIQAEHVLVHTGLYRYVRHPSYTGLLIEFAGLAVYFGTWVSVLVIVIPVTGAMLYRIRWEEIALRKTFGKQYEEYAAHTKSLIPGIV
jgi:protein-S-isoprenylcysteine O-methyltransferase